MNHAGMMNSTTGSRPNDHMPTTCRTRSVDDWPILEGLLTTRGADGHIHLAPMGPSVAPDWSRLLLRPFPSSTTGQNLIRDRQGVFHVTDDVELIAYAALGSLPATPPSHPAPHIDGFVLSDACQAYEIVVQDVDETGERVRIEATVVGVVRQRDFFGFNRAKHAVIEAAILATRFHLLNLDEVRADFDRLAVPVAKTGGPVERDTFAFLRAKLEERLREGGVG